MINMPALAKRWKAMMERDAVVLREAADSETLASMKRAVGDLPPALVKRFEESNARKMVPFLMKVLDESGGG